MNILEFYTPEQLVPLRQVAHEWHATERFRDDQLVKNYRELTPDEVPDYSGHLITRRRLREIERKQYFWERLVVAIRIADAR